MSGKTKDDKNCCGCKCCDSNEIAGLLRHVADFFEKKD